MEAMFRAATSGVLPEEPYKPDPSVAVQQILSYLYQNPQGVSELAIIDMISPLCSEQEAKLILGHLREKELLKWRGGRWFASTRVMDWGETGRIHSNIPDSKTYRVIDIDSGTEVGIIAGVFDEVFVLAGRIWKIVSVGSEIIKARRFRGKGSAPIFPRHKDTGAFYWLLPPELKYRRNNNKTIPRSTQK